jgi:hypothetical protein
MRATWHSRYCGAISLSWDNGSSSGLRHCSFLSSGSTYARRTNYELVIDPANMHLGEETTRITILPRLSRMAQRIFAPIRIQFSSSYLLSSLWLLSPWILPRKSYDGDDDLPCAMYVSKLSESEPGPCAE